MSLAAFLRHLGFAALLMLLSAATVRMMIAVRVMDTPEERKAHDQPTPKLSLSASRYSTASPRSPAWRIRTSAA
jgi:hypothetical protein